MHAFCRNCAVGRNGKFTAPLRPGGGQRGRKLRCALCKDKAVVFLLELTPENRGKLAAELVYQLGLGFPRSRRKHGVNY